MTDFAGGETLGELVRWAEERGAICIEYDEVAAVNGDNDLHRFLYLARAGKHVSLPTDAKADMQIHPIMGKQILRRLGL